MQPFKGSDPSEILNEYKDQVRILKQQIAELEDAGKSKDAANKRCLQKLEFCTKDLDDALSKIKELEEKKKMPFEMITMLGSTVLGGVMSIWSQSIKAKQAEQKMLLARAEVQQKGFKEAREYDNAGFQWTRRIIALTAVFAIVLLPKLMPVLQPDVTVIVGYLEFKPAFFFLPEKEIMKWVTLSSNSLVITPLDTNLVSAIIGLYFGGSLVKK